MQIYWNSNMKYVVLMNSLKERIGVGDSLTKDLSQKVEVYFCN